MQTTDARQMPMGTQLALQERDGQPKTREVRLGLVMYGGVSLAIYINGVAREFFRAVQGEGVYRLLKALTDADIVVDVISGTSAGGVNGILLAYALCNGKDFGSTAALWRQHGGIKNLLRSPYADTTSSSFLDSEGHYQPRLQEAFTAMHDHYPAAHDMPSAFNELDLFITGTDVDGRLYTQFDDAGHPIDVKDHRSVFLLKHRQGRKEPFKAATEQAATTCEALAKLARITSCFPAAFAPVHVAHVPPGQDSADALLQQWGQLGKEAVFLDGGVLDNKPFTYTTKAIFSRVADRDVDRKLFFVEPDPEAFTLPAQATNPNAVQAVLAALIGIPSYESIAADLRLLAERNSKLEQYNRLVRHLEQQPADALAAHPETHALYRRSRLVAFSERVVAGLFKSNGQPIQIKTVAQRQKAVHLIQAFDRIITDGNPLITDGLFQDFDVYFCLRRTFRLLYLIHALLYARPQDVQTPAMIQTAETYRHLQAVLNRQVKLYEVLQAAVERLLDEVPFPWETVPEDELWRMVQKALQALLQAPHFDREDPRTGARLPLLPDAFTPAGSWLSQPTLTAINDKLKERIQGIQDALHARTFDQTVNPQGPSLLRLVTGLEQQIIGHFLPSPADPVARAFVGFDALDSVLFPLELVGNLHEKDIIETVRISPKDAQRGFSENTLTNKVAGDTVYHFGGFFKRSWRSNDILWGRLDGLCQLVETLLTRDRIAQLVASENGRQKLRQRFFCDASAAGQPPMWHEALDPTLLFPHAGKPTHETCQRWLRDLLSDDPEARGNALDPERFDTMTSLLIEAAQLDVLVHEVPTVITDALDEQHEWNRYQVPAKRQPHRPATDSTATNDAAPPWVFIPSPLSPDPLVSSLTSTERAHAAMALLMASGETAPRPRETPLGRFFRDRYKVGAEVLLRDIPTPVLLEILATALLVVHNVVLGLFSAETQQRIKRSLLYRLGLIWPLRAFHGLTLLLRQAPRAGLAVLLGAIVLSVCTLSAGVIGWDRIWFPGRMFSLAWFSAFILIPLVILIVAVFILIKIPGKLRSPW